MPEVNRKQAQLLDGGTILDNPNGTAPGQMFARGHQLVLLFPGPPRELKPMMQAVMASVLAPRVGRARLFRRSLFVVGRGESHVEATAREYVAEWIAVLRAGRPDLDPGTAKALVHIALAVLDSEPDRP